VAVLVAAASGFAILLGGFGQGSSVVGLGLGIVRWRDFWIGARGTLLDVVLIILLARRYLVRLQAAGLSLPAKLIAVVTVTVGLRATLALVLSSLTD
jgi:hypothetical protein